MNKLLIIFFLVLYVFVVFLPFIQDVEIMKTNDFATLYNSIVVQEPVGGGPYGKIETIVVKKDGKKYSFRIARAYNGIKEGDIVNVTYLPHAKYAVIEEFDK